MATETRNPRKERKGVVVSDAMNKTVVVQADGKTFRVAREVKVATALPCDRAS